MRAALVTIMVLSTLSLVFGDNIKKDNVRNSRPKHFDYVPHTSEAQQKTIFSDRRPEHRNQDEVQYEEMEEPQSRQSSLLHLGQLYEEEGSELPEDKKVPQSYKFGYDVRDKYHGRQFRHEEKDKEGNVQGRFGYHDNTGQYRQVDYIADDHGFRANVRTNEAGTTNEDPADVAIQKSSDIATVEIENPKEVVDTEEHSAKAYVVSDNYQLQQYPNQDVARGEQQSEESRFGRKQVRDPRRYPSYEVRDLENTESTAPEGYARQVEHHEGAKAVVYSHFFKKQLTDRHRHQAQGTLRSHHANQSPVVYQQNLKKDAEREDKDSHIYDSGPASMYPKREHEDVRAILKHKDQHEYESYAPQANYGQAYTNGHHRKSEFVFKTPEKADTKLEESYNQNGRQRDHRHEPKKEDIPSYEVVKNSGGQPRYYNDYSSDVKHEVNHESYPIEYVEREQQKFAGKSQGQQYQDILSEYPATKNVDQFRYDYGDQEDLYKLVGDQESLTPERYRSDRQYEKFHDSENLEAQVKSDPKPKGHSYSFRQISDEIDDLNKPKKVHQSTLQLPVDHSHYLPDAANFKSKNTYPSKHRLQESDAYEKQAKLTSGKDLPLFPNADRYYEDKPRSDSQAPYPLANYQPALMEIDADVYKALTEGGSHGQHLIAIPILKGVHENSGNARHLGNHFESLRNQGKDVLLHHPRGFLHIPLPTGDDKYKLSGLTGEQKDYSSVKQKFKAIRYFERGHSALQEDKAQVQSKGLVDGYPREQVKSRPYYRTGPRTTYRKIDVGDRTDNSGTKWIPMTPMWNKIRRNNIGLGKSRFASSDHIPQKDDRLLLNGPYVTIQNSGNSDVRSKQHDGYLLQAPSTKNTSLKDCNCTIVDGTLVPNNS